jgi:hypothetical protein
MTTHSVRYVLSDRYDYRSMILGDAGPAFAADYGWVTCTPSTMHDHKADIFIIDDRLFSDELDIIRAAISDSKSIFLLKLCDPYAEWVSQHWWYRFAAELIDRHNVHYLLNYSPSEWTALLFVRARRSRFIVAPYVYQNENERDLDHAKRRRTLIVSGSMDPNLYPLRSKIAYFTRSPPLSLVTSRLEHPGYGDTTAKLSHYVIGTAYLDELSRYRYGVVCSSRCRLEFLKYREFAYAGIVPVGDMPSTLLDCPSDAWLSWRRNVFATFSALLSVADSQSRAESYRAFMRRVRDRDALRERVGGLLARLG